MKRLLTTFGCFVLAVIAHAQTIFTADQIEKYAKEKYGDKWMKDSSLRRLTLRILPSRMQV